MLSRIYRRIRYIPANSHYDTGRFKAHPLSRFPVSENTPQLDPGHGLIALRSKGVRRLQLGFDERGNRLSQPRPQVAPPVFLIDGTPVATGFGTGHILLPTGSYRLEVQAGASGPYVQVQVPDQGRVRLKSVVSSPVRADIAHDRLFWLYSSFALGRRAFLERKRGLAAPILIALALFVLTLIFGFGFSREFVAQQFGPDQTSGPLPTLLCMVPGVLAGILWIVVRWAQAKARAMVKGPLNEFAPTALAGGGSWSIVDPDEAAPPTTRPDMATLRVDVAFEHNDVDATRPLRLVVPNTHSQLSGDDNDPGVAPSQRYHAEQETIEILGENLEHAGKSAKKMGREIAHEFQSIPWRDSWRSDVNHYFGTYSNGRAETEIRPWIAPPIISLEDRELPAIWGCNEYVLPPGVRLIEIAVPPPPSPLASDTEIALPADARRIYQLDLKPGSSTHIESIADIKCSWSHDGQSLTQYSAHIHPLRSPSESTH
ncbi:YrzE family protein [Natronoglycomyces albus]|uniref:TIGR04086 family membrane protein n=1 Tax=Natronoglycomyces albus TaxID=2811108 RepID=A0A895XP71_9ACTN|nr:YrzE family protein [Natronoglycomyces albus]QSB05179.1 TIGR04086 family membrane protein [Natronoglycomyces albus]